MSEPVPPRDDPRSRPPTAPAAPARASTGADPDWLEYQSWVDREAAAGQDPEPPVWAPDEPGDWSYEESARPRFGQGDQADLLPPGPRLVRLTEEATRGLGCLSDDELVGVIQAARRQVAREQYKEALATAAYGRRQQAAFESAARRGIPVGCRPGGFPGEDLAVELVITRAEAGHRIDDAIDLTSRLPRTLAGMAAGQIDEDRAGWIALYTRSLSVADVARADEILAEAAPDLRTEQLARKAAAAHPRTRWCVTLTAPDGTAAAHGCARGPRPRLLHDLEPKPPPGQPPRKRHPPPQQAQLAELLRRLDLTFTPVITDPCDHTQAEPRYTPSRKLRHLVRARAAKCDAPGCHAPALI